LNVKVGTFQVDVGPRPATLISTDPKRFEPVFKQGTDEMLPQR